MKFPLAVQNLFKIQKEREAFTSGKPEATSCPSGSDTSFKCWLLVRKSKNTPEIFHNTEKYSDDWLFWKSSLEPIKKLLFRFN